MQKPEDSDEAVFSALKRDFDIQQIRSDIDLTEIPAPRHVAPWCAAYSADIIDTERYRAGTARLVIAYNAAVPESWGSNLRCIAYVKVPMEADVIADPLLSDVAWSWLEDGLDDHTRGTIALAGTITKLINRGYGALANDSEVTEIEIRASWSPEPLLGFHGHKLAWIDLLAHAAGLPPIGGNVTSINPSRLADA